MPAGWDPEGPTGVGSVPGDGGHSVAEAVRVGTMRRRHLRTVVHIEEECYPEPWSATVFLSELAQRSSRRYTVATIGPLLVGYCGLMVVEEDGHITTLTVDPPWQHRGVGTVLLLDQARAAPGLGVRHLTLEVRVSNDAAQALYRRFGFAPVGVRRNYYAETNEDAIVMWARDVDAEEYARRLDGIEAALRSAP
ncbi:MAG TPA: ribosomal protein S18-alanine N-acetyltransferase [Acidimicrobiales bacterium]|nr:ribosomal protein S18-alanine N-acetyltransferase [Acidimicrobiales bacterium]